MKKNTSDFCYKAMYHQFGYPIYLIQVETSRKLVGFRQTREKMTVVTTVIITTANTYINNNYNHNNKKSL